MGLFECAPERERRVIGRSFPMGRSQPVLLVPVARANNRHRGRCSDSLSPLGNCFERANPVSLGEVANSPAPKGQSEPSVLVMAHNDNDHDNRRQGSSSRSSYVISHPDLSERKIAPERQGTFDVIRERTEVETMHSSPVSQPTTATVCPAGGRTRRCLYSLLLVCLENNSRVFHSLRSHPISRIISRLII